MKPLYIWAGGKNKMIPKYRSSPGIPLSGYDTFVEPFFGGGAMMIYIYKNNPNVKRFILNDINSEIVGIYRAIKSDVDNFILRMDNLSNQFIPLNKTDRKKFYYNLRNEYINDYAKWSPTEESASLYFLMKTGFNGIWQVNQTSNGRFATPSGLLNQKTVVYDKDNVLEWNKFLQIVDIYCGDWLQSCQGVNDRAFFFFDPPYRDSFTQYGQTFNDSDHDSLINFCRQQDTAGDLVFYCNRDAGDNFYTQRQGQLSLYSYPVIYTAGRRKKNKDGSQTAKKATEILLASPTINCPADDQEDKDASDLPNHGLNPELFEVV